MVGRSQVLSAAENLPPRSLTQDETLTLTEVRALWHPHGLMLKGSSVHLITECMRFLLLYLTNSLRSTIYLDLSLPPTSINLKTVALEVAPAKGLLTARICRWWSSCMSPPVSTTQCWRRTTT